MKLFFFYVTRTVKNNLRRLFKSWVAILLIACLAFGLLVGVGAAMLEKAFPTEEEEEVPEEEMSAAETAQAFEFLELACGGIVLLVLAMNVVSADKNGCAIFQPADVNLLFSSPMKPQSVLLFRLMMQIGTSLLLSLYLAFQLPSIISGTGMPVWAALTLLGTWVLLLVLGKFLQVLLYSLSATHPSFRARMRPTLVGVLLLIGGAFLLYWKSTEAEPLDAAISFFNAPATRYIPVWGWLKGGVMFAFEGNLPATLLSLGGTICLTALLLFIIYRIRVDFYEDAMAKSQETAELQERAQNDGKSLVKRKKDRSEKLRRDGLSRGTGASVFFFKTMYNRFRFAHFHVFTKTSETYLAVAAVSAVVLRFYVESTSLTPVALALAVMAFFRSLGNPIADDTQKDLFLIVPENAWKKVFWSMLGGTLNTFLDLLPALAAAVLILGANPLVAVAWLLFILSIDVYSSGVGLFIDLSLPTATSQGVKSLVQILFIYFGLLPSAVMLIVGSIFSLFSLMAILATLVNLTVGALFLSVSPLFLEYGRK